MMNWKRLAISFVFVIFLMGSAAAAEWDNVKSYDAETQTITITNLLGLGGTIATYQLTENTEQCLINCYATIETVLFEEGVLANDIEFKNKVGDTKIINDFKYFLNVSNSYDVEVDDYVEVCGNDNGTAYCNYEVNGSHTEERIVYKYKRYLGTVLPVGTYQWKIEGRKEITEEIDWIVRAFGKDLTEWAWWNAAWDKKKRINITNGVASALTNYQVALNITYDSDMQTDFDDLRFLDVDEANELDFFLEVKTDSNWAYVWVEMPSIESSGTNATYMYYDNAGASSTSNGDNTFILYEDWDDFTTGDAGIPANGWTQAGAGALVGITEDPAYGGSGKSAYVNISGATTFLDKSFPITAQGRARVKYFVWKTDQRAKMSMTNLSEDWAGGHNVFSWDDGRWATHDGSGYAYYSNVVGEVWNDVEIIWWANDTHSVNINDTFAFNLADDTNPEVGKIEFMSQFYGATEDQSLQVDNIMVTEFVTPEPTYVVSAEEQGNSVSTSLVSPADYYNSTVSWINFIWNSNASGLQLTNTTFYIWNSTLHLVNSTFFEITGTDNQTALNLTSILQENYTWNADSGATGLAASLGTNRSTNVLFTVTSNLNTPVDNYNSSVNWIEFIWSSNSSESILTNTTFYIWNSTLHLVNSTYYGITGSSNQTTLNLTSLPQGNYVWNAEAGATGLAADLDTNRTLQVHLVSTDLNITYPHSLIPTMNSGDTIVLNWTISEGTTDLTTHVTNCSYTYNGARTELSVATCVQTNATTFTYVSGVNTISMNVTEVFGFQTINTSTWTVSIQDLLQSSYNDTGVSYYNEEWASSFNSSASVVTANLWHNGTSYPAAVSNVTTAFSTEVNFTIPDSFIGNNTFHWQYILDGTKTNTSSQTQNFTGFNFGLCNSTLDTTYLNLTFVNETVAEEATTAFIASSSWSYYGSNSSLFKQLSFVNATENFNYTFCGESTNKTIQINTSIKYDNSLSEQRTYAIDFTPFTNVTTDYSLYLLPTSEGTFVTFQVIDIAEQVISTVSANVSKSGTLIGTGFTDDAGTITFFLDPDNTYKFVFAKTGYSTYTTTFQPTQTSYTITLGSQGVGTGSGDFLKGMEYYVSPDTVTYNSPGTSLTNNTNTKFSFAISSSFWTITEYGFAMYNSSGHNLNSTSASTNGGTLSLYVDTLNDTLMKMNYYWVVTGNMTNGTQSWTIFDSSGTGYGISNLFSRLTTYLNSDEGLLGADSNFDLAMLAFIAIFGFTGIISFKFGVTSPQIVTAVLLISVIMVDIGLGLLPAQGIASTIMFIVSAAIWIKEGI